MSPEPSKKIEERLRGHAQERRQQAGVPDAFALHAATRRMLQGEVSRHYPAVPSAASVGETPLRSALVVWLRGWRAAAFAGACVVLLGAGVWMAMQGHNELGEPTADFAKHAAPAPSTRENQPVADESSLRLQGADRLLARKELPPAATTASGTTPAASVESKMGSGALVGAAGARFRGAETAQAAPSATATVPPAVSAEATDKFLALKNEAAMPPRPAAAPRSEPAASGSLISADVARVDAIATAPSTRFYRALPSAAAVSSDTKALPEEPATAWKFRRADSAAVESLAKKAQKDSAAQALEEFTVEQRGAVMRVTDADGSVYEGATIGGDVAASEPERQKAMLRSTKAASEEGAPGAFRVSGTNRTLNQLIVLEGRMDASAPVAVGQRGVAAPATAKAKQADFGAQQSPQITNAPSIEGTLRIGGSAPVLFRARVRE